jgi:large subunit ribosomal protein L32
MAVPKKRTTAATQGMRRSHQALKSPVIVACANCGKDVKPHTVCKACGVYRGRTLIKTA